MKSEKTGIEGEEKRSASSSPLQKIPLPAGPCDSILPRQLFLLLPNPSHHLLTQWR